MGLLNNDLGKKIYILPQDDIITTSFAPTVDSRSPYIMLSATESFDKTEMATVTQYPISTGATVGDHHRFDGTTINFSGIISGAGKIPSIPFGHEVVDSEAEVINYIKRLRSLVRRTGGTSPLVSIYLPQSNGENNCIITSLKITRDASVSNGYKVDISARKLLLATTEFRVVTASDEFEPEVTQGQNLGTSSTGYEIEQAFF